MAANYLHGVETVRVDRSPRAVQVVKSAVITVAGCAPAGPVNEPVLSLTEKDGAAFGPMLTGFNIPETLDAIYDQGAASVIVINVLDPAIHKTANNDQTGTFDAVTGRLNTPHAALTALVIKSPDGATTYEEIKDYTVDKLNGIVTRTAESAIPVGGSVKLDEEYLDPSKVTPADLIGTIDAVTGKKTGMKIWPDTYQRFGFFPKLFIAPGYSSLRSVSTEMVAYAEKFGGKALIDAPIGTTRDQAVAMRGPTVADSPFNTSSRAAILCYPHVTVYDKATDGTSLQPLSGRAAGVIAAKDFSNGYWWSPSNTEIKGIVGMEMDLSARIDDPQSDVNLLNENGICTIFNSFGTGFRFWGNRSANWPSETGLTTFICVTRTQDIIDESLRYFALQYMDRPINDALIDAVVESVNQFLRTLRGNGAILDGVCWFDPDRNEETEMANGHLLFNYKFTPPPPWERGTFESELTSEYLVNLKGGA